MAPKAPTPAQIAALKKSKGVKPTAAFTKPSQKATGLAKSTVKDRFASTAKTPVKNNVSDIFGRGPTPQDILKKIDKITGVAKIQTVAKKAILGKQKKK
jgi:hypothetical protein